MIRFVATFCFLVTLLCPVFCLAGEEGGCSDHAPSSGRNCEAMTVGAVVVESQVIEASADHALPLLDQIAVIPPSTVSQSWFQLTTWNRANAQPPPAARRQALLQTFLF